jgi:hypothetical protein
MESFWYSLKLGNNKIILVAFEKTPIDFLYVSGVVMDLVLVNYVHRSDNGLISQAPQLGIVYVGTSAKLAGYKIKILAGDDVSIDLKNLIQEMSTPEQKCTTCRFKSAPL